MFPAPIQPVVRTLRQRPRRRDRRAVVAVLAMMFMVLFGSLGLAMAIASKGNLRTAATHLHVVKAVGAAETGMAIAQQRLGEAAARFLISKGVINTSVGNKLWDGTLSAAVDGPWTVLPPTTYTESTLPAGVAAALMNAHKADQNTVSVSGVTTQPILTVAPAGTDTSVYRSTGWVVTPPVAIDGNGGANSGEFPAAFQVTYAPLANGTDVRVIVTGYSAVNSAGSTFVYGGSAGNDNRPLSRTIYQDYRFAKKFKHAILSPSKLMLGKNVSVEGPVGAMFDDVTKTNGDPMLMKSDFYGLDPVLDAKLNDFFAGVKQYDVDGDNQLRFNHATESQGIPSNGKDYKGDGTGKNSFLDFDGDGYLSDFDIFCTHFDKNKDGKVVLSAKLTAGTPADGQTPEFTVDDDLALLIDSSNPDRNRNGISGFTDTNNNGRWDPGEALADANDQVLGYRDGVIDKKDRYYKLRGKASFKVTESTWETARGNTPYQTYLQGSILPAAGDSAVAFGVSTSDVPDPSTMDFSNVANPLAAKADGQTFDQQLAAQLGVSTGALSTYTEVKSDKTKPRFFRANMDNTAAKALTGQDLWERMPYNSPSFVDWYIRPRYENMTFTNVVIPRGNNGLFVNCTFVGVTNIKSYTANTHPNWSLYGMMSWSASSGMPVYNTTALDKSDFLRYTTGLTTDGPANYSDFPDPPTIDGTIKTGGNRNTKLYSNNIRFHDCTIVGSIVSDTPSTFTQVRNKLQFTGSTSITAQNPKDPTNAAVNPRPADMDLINTTSMMVPNYSVEVGQFNAPTDMTNVTGAPKGQNVNLNGTIVAGELDARGNTTIDGALLLTYKPVLGQGVLQSFGQPVGNPANFNCTLGYFGPSDGENESLDPNTLPIVGGQRIVGWDTNGDGLPDVAPDQPQPGGSTAIPFYGYGRVVVRLNSARPMPDGIMLPVSVTLVQYSYGEGRP